MTDKCLFDVTIKSCSILTSKNCEGCSFYKSGKLYESAVVQCIKRKEVPRGYKASKNR